MTEPALISLFDEMDAAAEALGEALTRDDLQIEFRQIWKARMPELSTVEWLDRVAS